MTEERLNSLIKEFNKGIDSLILGILVAAVVDKGSKPMNFPPNARACGSRRAKRSDDPAT